MMTVMTFSGSDASDLEDVHDNLVAEAELLGVVERGRHLGEPEVLLIRGYRKRILKLALEMTQQLSFIAPYRLDDYKVEDRE